MSTPRQLLRQFTFGEIAFLSRSSGFLSLSYFYQIDIVDCANPKMTIKNPPGVSNVQQDYPFCEKSLF